MPRTQKKGGAGKGKRTAKGKRNSAAAAVEKEKLVQACRSFLRVYQKCCAATDSVASSRICRDCREAVESEKPLARV